jgi:uncharacterized protein
MNGSVTISARTLVTGLLVAAALVVAYLIGGSGGSPPAAADEQPPAAETGEQPRELTMTGRGEASAVPDQLSFAVAVDLTRPDLDQALDAANASMARVLAVLRKHGVEKDDVQTTGLSMEPVYDYHASGPPTLRGYRVSERASVLVDELARAGAAVSAAVDAGGNDVRVDQLRLLVGDTDEVMAQARAAAVEQARTKAEQYAAASGQDLGEVVTIGEVKAEPLPTPVSAMYRGEAALDSAISKVPIRAGRDEAAVTVRIVWELA